MYMQLSYSKSMGHKGGKKPKINHIRKYHIKKFQFAFASEIIFQILLLSSD